MRKLINFIPSLVRIIMITFSKQTPLLFSILVGATLLISCGGEEPDNPYPNGAKAKGSNYVYDNIVFNVSGNKATAVGFDNKTIETTNLNIPATISVFDSKTDSYVQCNVETIGDAAFQNCSDLKELTIPNSVTTIGMSAFSYCTQLNNVIFGNSLYEIGASAFSYCRNINELRFPNSLEIIGPSAFEGNSSGYEGIGLAKVVFGTGLKKIGRRAFYLNNDLSVFVFKGKVPPVFENSALSTERLASLAFAIFVPDDSIEDYINSIKESGYINGYSASRWVKPLSTYSGDY